ncbi:hypothetical protein C923_04301 [Plasmodium falciparum UGT5.1]|uniref:Fam-b protein n=7 Tax=Plasmodium falciparum TaxID=5833 RepID=W4IYN4_PLAFP|nr:hypothetical protein PFFVO_05456 [Plasmodium falciparum Vietnam Oak-Knoll (FVO)]ETW40219.1 hypothetical protein PFNF135_05447 [Plasmodium falciparum NF135/5.C10]ETW54467.1 hypothetical protein PFUGPA_04333 [Plasmodium falciparum Palo Alto/Uganda]ETW58789.1 hypothetical protein PFMC_05882 [Plasmodium falciparum CAMP/Malaysia]EWC75030.1 hypothetical protein C923_04301 [Plasmodium falciparum UGT5.1]
MNKFFLFLHFILGLFNSNKIFYDTFLNISENGNITYYNLIRRLSETYSNIDETTDKMLQTYMKNHINNENDNDIDTISNYDIKDKKNDYFYLLKQEINDAKNHYTEHVSSLNNGSHRNSIQTLRGKLEFYDNLFIDKMLDLRIQKKHSPLLYLLLLTLFDLYYLYHPFKLIIPVYFLKRLSFLRKVDEDLNIQKVGGFKNFKLQ